MEEEPPVKRLRLVSGLASVVMIAAALLMGLWPVAGTYDSESFTCGSAFLGTSDDLGYGGTENYDACLRERSHLRWIALGNVTVGVVLLGAVGSSRR
jgi:hypothetical protein